MAGSLPTVAKVIDQNDNDLGTFWFEIEPSRGDQITLPGGSPTVKYYVQAREVTAGNNPNKSLVTLLVLELS